MSARGVWWVCAAVLALGCVALYFYGVAVAR